MGQSELMEGDILHRFISNSGQIYFVPAGTLCYHSSLFLPISNPFPEILPIIKWVGERNQIFNVHLRNIRDGWDNFEEVYPDNGDLDFFQILKLLRDLDYPYLVMPDHVPYHPDPAKSKQGFAFAYGFIKAMLQVLANE